MAKIEHDQPNPSARASIKVWIIHTTNTLILAYINYFIIILYRLML